MFSNVGVPGLIIVLILLFIIILFIYTILGGVRKRNRKIDEMNRKLDKMINERDGKS